MPLAPESIEAFFNHDTYVPDNLRDGIKAYIETGRPVGSFLAAIICNDLKGAVFSGHPGILINIPSIVRWFWNYAPSSCHGNENNYRGWTDARQKDMQERKSA